MSLDTLDNVKLTLAISGETDDPLLTALQNAADNFVETYCGRIFTGGDFSEDHPGGGRTVFLANYPIDDVDSVNVDPNRSFSGATVWDASRYVVHKDRGVIEALDGPFVGDRGGAHAYPNAIRVSYHTPTNAVPMAVKRAYAELIGHWYRQAKTYQDTSQVNYLKKTDGTAVTRYPWGQSGGYPMPVPVKQILDLFRTPL